MAHSMTLTSEFSLIKRYFSQLTTSREDVVLGVGDDCALLVSPKDALMAVSIDTLVEGVHFFADVDPFRLGHKALAVNLSDLAAMGAQPAWFTLALTLPTIDPKWLKAFSEGLAALAQQHQIQLVGGDTTRGHLSITVQVHGHVATEKALRRSSAQVGDKIYVTGSLGDAGAGLQIKLGQLATHLSNIDDVNYLVNRLEMPTPRNDIGVALAGYAHAAIDISDGLLADLGHILAASQVGAVLDLNNLPYSPALQTLPSELAQRFALTGGDDYELCFTADARHIAPIRQQFPDQIHCIGEVVAESGVFYSTESGLRPLTLSHKGYDHFA